MSDEFDLTIRPQRKQRIHSANPLPKEPFDDTEPAERELDDNGSVSSSPKISIEYKTGERSQANAGSSKSDSVPRRKTAAYTAPRRQHAVKRTPSKRNKFTVSDFFTSRQTHVFSGIVLLVIASVFAVVLWSYLKNAVHDQSHILNSAYATHPEAFANVGRGFGAWVSHVLFGEALGLGAWMVVVYLSGLGISIIWTSHRVHFFAFTFKCLLLAIATSMTAGLISYEADSVVFWGGIQGHYANKWLFDNAGWPGDFAVNLLLLAAVICVFYNALSNAWRFVADHLPSHKYNEDDDIEAVDVIGKVTDHPAQSVVKTNDDGKNDGEGSGLKTVVNPKGLDDDDLGNHGFDIDGSENEVAGDKPIVAEFEVPALDTDAAPLDEPYVPVEEGLYDHRAELAHYKMPSTDLLREAPVRATIDSEEQNHNIERIVKTLNDYRVEVESIKAIVGPTVTLYEIVPKEGTRIAHIKRLEDELAMNLEARGIRIIAPIPGKGAVGIEVPNKEPQTVAIRSTLESRKFRETKKELPVIMGATIQNEVFVADLASMPHVLVAGATGQGKSVGLNVIIASLLYKKHPSELKFVLIDPKEVEFSLYERLERHYLAKLPDDDSAIVTDTERVLTVLNSLCVEMDNRYALLRQAGVKNITEYNQKFTNRQLNPEKGHFYMPYIVVIIDEFADLIMTAGKDIEKPVMRITQKARAVGIHMIIATQRPSTNVLTGLIKANCPTRIAFRVMQMVDSRTILDRPGANQLIGRGDMLYSAGGEIERMQGAFISTEEIDALMDCIDAQPGFAHSYILPEPLSQESAGEVTYNAAGSMERDSLFDEAARFIVSQPTASTSSLQRRYNIGYNRAGKIIDQMEAAGIVGPASGSKPRAVLVDAHTLELMLDN